MCSHVLATPRLQIESHEIERLLTPESLVAAGQAWIEDGLKSMGL